MLPTDTQKNTAYAYAKTVGLESIEEYGLALARHFVHDVEPVAGARIEIEQYDWDRVPVRYRDGRLRGHLWPDVAPCLRAWAAGGVRLAVYSSGSEEAQRLLFGHSEAGDLTPLLSGFFDTRIGDVSGRGKLAASNAEQVAKIRRIVEDLGAEIATPEEAREILGLKGGDQVGF